MAATTSYQKPDGSISILNIELLKKAIFGGSVMQDIVLYYPDCGSHSHCFHSDFIPPRSNTAIKATKQAIDVSNPVLDSFTAKLSYRLRSKETAAAVVFYSHAQRPPLSLTDRRHLSIR